jgi:hypothetical protein
MAFPAPMAEGQFFRSPRTMQMQAPQLISSGAALSINPFVVCPDERSYQRLPSLFKLYGNNPDHCST